MHLTIIRVNYIFAFFSLYRSGLFCGNKGTFTCGKDRDPEPGMSKCSICFVILKLHLERFLAVI